MTFDLTGLPPTPEEVATFLNGTDATDGTNESHQSHERLVDRLLASPRCGERMARAWLDLVRHADGDGYRADDYRPDVFADACGPHRNRPTPSQAALGDFCQALLNAGEFLYTE